MSAADNGETHLRLIRIFFWVCPIMQQRCIVLVQMDVHTGLIYQWQAAAAHHACHHWLLAPCHGCLARERRRLVQSAYHASAGESASTRPLQAGLIDHFARLPTQCQTHSTFAPAYTPDWQLPPLWMRKGCIWWIL